MIWADRAAIGLLGLAAIVIALILALGFLGPSDFFPITATNVGRAVGWFLGTGVLVVLPLWLALRIVDWVFGGPARRAAQRKRISAAEEPRVRMTSMARSA